MSSVGTDALIGSELLGYRVEALLGRGGMGVVYRAYDARLKRNVALKLVAPELAADERFRERFLAESELAASLEHPNVVPIHGAGVVDGQLAIAMRYVEGTDLKTLLREQGVLEPKRALAIASQVADALDAAHERGLVHRDVKPSNVLLDSHERVYLADFGLTRRLAEQGIPAGPGLSLGTPAYASPEQIEGGEVDGRADVYSLGCVLFECLTGEVPFARDSELAVLWAHLQELPPKASERNPALPEAFDAVTAKALAKQPDQRYATCGELVDAAREALGLRDVVLVRDRKPLLVAAAGIVLALAAALTAFFLSRGDGGPQKPSTKPTLTPKTDSLQRIEPKTNRLAATIRLSSSPTAVAVGEGAVWLTSSAAGTISKVDPMTNEVESSPAGAVPVSVAVGQGVVWVVNRNDATLTRIDPETLAIEQTVPMLADAPHSGGGGAVVGDREFWVANVAGVERRGLYGEKIALIEDLPSDAPSPSSLVLAEGALWTPEYSALARIDTRKNRVSARIPIPVDPAVGITGIAGIAGGEGSIWLTIAVRDALLQIDARKNRVTKTIRVGDVPVGVAVGEGSVWVANHDDGTVSRIDPEKGKVVSTIDVGPNPSEIAAGEGGVWVTVDPE